MKRKMKNLVGRIIRKSNKIVLFLYAFLKVFFKKEDEILPDEAERILSEYSKDPGSSPLRKNIIGPFEYDLSIIVPAYNVEQYIKECLDSLVNQKTKYTYKIIVVNDGSTDNTGEIIETYKSCENVEIINQKNQGLSGARNTGLEHIRSRYVFFVDSDDVIADGSIEAMMDYAIKTESDVVQGGMLMFADSSLVKIREYKYNDEENIQPIGTMPGYACGKLFDARLFENICFPLKYWYEDSIIRNIVFPTAKKVSTISKIVYKYRIRESGICSSSISNPKGLDAFWVTRSVLSAREKLGINTDEYLYADIMAQIVNAYKVTAKAPDIVKKSLFFMTKELLKKEKRKGNFALERKYYELEQAILGGHYKRYCFLCRLY